MPLASSQPWFDCGETAPLEGRWKGSSGIWRKSYVPFLGEEATAMPPPYPTLLKRRSSLIPEETRIRDEVEQSCQGPSVYGSGAPGSLRNHLVAVPSVA